MVHKEKHTFSSVYVESHPHTTSIYRKTTKRTVSHNSIMTLLGYKDSLHFLHMLIAL